MEFEKYSRVLNEYYRLLMAKISNEVSDNRWIDQEWNNVVASPVVPLTSPGSVIYKKITDYHSG